MKRRIVFFLAALLLLPLVACAAKQPQQTQTPEGLKLRIGTTSVIETATRGEYAYDMLASGVSEPPLVCQNVDGSYSGLVVDYESDDALVWTYRVRDGMMWSDGVPVTAEDILFTLQYEDAEGSANFQPQTAEDGKVTGAKYSGYALSADGRSISLTLSAPNVRELSNMTSFRIMPKHIYEGKSSVSEAEARVGCGPFQLEAFLPEAGTLRFVPNPYYPEQPTVEEITYRLFGNEDTLYLALQNGDIHMVWNYSVGVPATYQEVLDALPQVRLIGAAAVNAPAVLAFQNAEGLFADKNLRRAVSCALDYEAFRLYFGSRLAALPGRGFVPGSTLGYRETEQLKQDLAAAADCMAAAGYTQKNAEGFYVDAMGKPLGFTLTVNAKKSGHVGCAELVKTNLEEFGIQVNLETLDADSYNAKTSNKFSESHITMEAAICGFTAAGMGMKDGLGSIYVDGRHPVQGGCQVYDPRFQQILDDMSAAKTIGEYSAAAGALQDFYAEETPLIALYWDSQIYACATALENVQLDALFGLNHIRNWFSITTK